MKTRIIVIIAILILVALLFSYGTSKSTQTDTVDVDALRTAAVATYASSLTETMVAASIASQTVTVEPTATLSEATATLGTPESADPCYSLLWLKDITIPDGTHLKANEVFTKTWQIQNNGGCAFPPGFTFSHVGGDLMRGQTITLEEPIPVGAKREISIQLVAPDGVNGLTQSSWRMADAEGNYFGDTLSVNILVGTIATPAVTNTP